ncbi:A disintegrin and metalloproteinase with thrombospondin motifs 1 [Chionoecetes opilio]|uniref:A disintegrin and metalloproteinase with thrombospondin motifs 1 n=1 Tax=Chionoecetes opilio TaxID=41210 RepID=A0A8J5CPR5_CHIOP|nr:A disintegrin and metalloproteinase with thrombospondin motifs 1 [Chionoecetes opilio]
MISGKHWSCTESNSCIESRIFRWVASLVEEEGEKEGKCVALGCDKVVKSQVREDECGVCGGDGATCTPHTQIYHRTPPMSEYSLVTTVPAGAWNIEVQEDVPTGNFLALRDNSSSFFLNGDGNSEPSKTFISKSPSCLMSLSLPFTCIHGTAAREEVQVTTTFLTQLRPEYFQWEVGPYTACSVTCGG